MSGSRPISVGRSNATLNPCRPPRADACSDRWSPRGPEPGELAHRPELCRGSRSRECPRVGKRAGIGQVARNRAG
jgi:hypothetical protein